MNTKLDQPTYTTPYNPDLDVEKVTVYIRNLEKLASSMSITLRDNVEFIHNDNIKQTFTHLAIQASNIMGKTDDLNSDLRDLLYAYKVLHQYAQNIKMIFGEHVSPQVAEKLMNNVDMDKGQEMEVSVFFLDVRNFTTHAENKSPKEIFDFLNMLFQFMIEIITEHKGVINKFLGDGFMAIFGAPIDDINHAENAILSALRIQEVLKTKIQSGQIPNINIGVGIHSGTALVGNIGSKLRKEYTIIGDVVNLTARIEQLNKEKGTTILISADTFVCCKQHTISFKESDSESPNVQPTLEKKKRIIVGNLKDINKNSNQGKKNEMYLLKNLGLHAIRGRQKKIKLFTIETMK